VRFAAETGRDLSALALSELQKFSPLIDNDVFSVLTLEGSINSRNHIGGTSPDQVRASIRRAREWMGGPERP
jgi:argininosuccinate lyase